METLEISAKTVNEAVDIALEKLDAKLSEVAIVILSEGRAGILGVGAEEARIRVTKLDPSRSRMANANFPPRPPFISYTATSPSAPPSYMDEDDEEEEQPQPTQRPLPPPRPQTSGGRQQSNNRPQQSYRQPAPAPINNIPTSFPPESRAAAQAGKEVLAELMQHLGFRAELVETNPPVPVPATSDMTVAFDVRGEDLGLLIGRRGQTLSSLQFIVNLMVNRRLRSSALIVVDVEGYRARRYQTLRGLAERMADRVRRSGQAVTLEPMNASERRIIHMSLQDHQDVTTQSSGEGENRKVSIIPKRR